MPSVLLAVTLNRAHFLIENYRGIHRSPSFLCVVGPDFNVRCDSQEILSAQSLGVNTEALKDPVRTEIRSK